MTKRTQRSGEADGFTAVVILGLIVSGVLIAIEQRGVGFRQGVIAATRGTHTAKLVDKGDGTTEWRVEEKGVK